MNKTRSSAVHHHRELFPRVLYAWLLRFTLQAGFVVGWTSLVAKAVTGYGITALPVILMFQAVAVIVGMLLFSVLLERLPLRQVIILVSVMAIVCFSIGLINYGNKLHFLIFTISASGLFVSQISFLITAYIEEIFTPFEAEKAYPVIETSHPAGGILGGALLAVGGAGFLSEKLIGFWIVMLVMFLVTFTIAEPAGAKCGHHSDKPFLCRHRLFRGKFDRVNAVGKTLKEFKKLSFFGVLLVILVLNTFIFHFIEFQYTNAVNQSIGNLSSGEHESALTHGLGLVHLFMHTLILVVNLFLVENIFKKYGSFGGFFIHSIAVFFSVLVMLFSNGFASALLAKNNFEITNLFKKNSYEISYYAFREGTQRAIREIYEGFAVPMAGILATGFILFIQWFFLDQHFYYVIQLMLIACVCTLLLFSFYFKRSYTRLVLDTLRSSNEADLLGAIEVMGQSGHENSKDILAGLYLRHKNNAKVKRKINEALGHLSKNSV